MINILSPFDILIEERNKSKQEKSIITAAHTQLLDEEEENFEEVL